MFVRHLLGKFLVLAALASGFEGAAGVEFPLRWRWSNPAPHGGNVVDMAYSPALSLGIQVAERGQIYVSRDLDVWTACDSGTTNALRAVAFLGPRILITGENGLVLYADDPSVFRPGTLLDGPTTAWLEAVATSPTLAVAAGDAGSIYTSPDGVLWKKQASGSTAWFRAAAYGGGVFVVAGDSGTILTSANGTNWTKRTVPTTAHLNRVNYGNARFTAVGDAGVTISSTNNGVSWFPEYPGATNVLHGAVTGGPDRLLAGDQEIRIQHNQVWSNELTKTNGPPSWTYYTALGLPGFFTVAGQTGLLAEGYQAGDMPYSWLLPYNSVRNWLWDVMRLPSFYVAVGDRGTVMTSGNGVDWVLELVPPAVTNAMFLGIGGTTNLLVAVGEGGKAIYSPNILSNIVITNASGVLTQTLSSLGVVWLPVPPFTTNDLQAAGVLGNSLYVVGGAKGVLFSSSDGTNWTPRASPATNLLSSIANWPGGLVAVGDYGTLLTSPDGISWSRVTLGTTNWLYRVRWLNHTLLIVGQKGTILTSTNAVNWSSRTSGTTAWLTDAAYVGDTWFAIGASGTVLSSSNLVSWVNRGTLTKKALYGASTDSGQLVIVGVEGVILRSQVIPDLTPVSFLNYSRVTTNSPPAAYNIYLFGGKPDQRFTLDRTTNLTSQSWTTGPLLEIFDGSGTLYYVETLSGTNQAPLEYYRATLEP